jgi:hypothetical protein
MSESSPSAGSRNEKKPTASNIKQQSNFSHTSVMNPPPCELAFGLVCPRGGIEMFSTLTRRFVGVALRRVAAPRNVNTSFALFVNRSVFIPFDNSSSSRRLLSTTSSSSSSSSSSSNHSRKGIMGSDNACPGCGAGLQSDRPHEAGYITVEPLTTTEDDAELKKKQKRGSKQFLSAGVGEIEHLKAQMAEEYGEDAMQELFSSRDPDSVWFNDNIDQSSRKSTTERVLRRVCQRCFSLRNYGKLLPVTGADRGRHVVNELLLPLRSQQVFVIQLIDLFDVGGTLIDDFHKYLGPTARVFLVANKIDLMPIGIQADACLATGSSATSRSIIRALLQEGDWRRAHQRASSGERRAARRCGASTSPTTRSATFLSSAAPMWASRRLSIAFFASDANNGRGALSPTSPCRACTAPRWPTSMHAVSATIGRASRRHARPGEPARRLWPTPASSRASACAPSPCG